MRTFHLAHLNEIFRPIVLSDLILFFFSFPCSGTTHFLGLVEDLFLSFVGYLGLGRGRRKASLSFLNFCGLFHT